MDQLLNKDPTELYYMKGNVFRKDVNTNNNWTFDLRNSRESTPTFRICGFQVRKKLIRKHMILQNLIVCLFQMQFVK